VDVGVMDGHRSVRDRPEHEAKQPLRREEHPVTEIFQLQVRQDLGLIEVVGRQPHLLGVVAVVPGRDPDAGVLPIGDGLHRGDFLADAGQRRFPHRLHERHRPLRRAGHRMLEPPVGMRRVAEQPRSAGAEHENPRSDGIVVGRAAAVAAADEHPPNPLPNATARCMHEERLDGRPRVADHPTGQTGGRGRLTRRVAERLGQPGEVFGRGEMDFLFSLIAKHVL